MRRIEVLASVRTARGKDALGLNHPQDSDMMEELKLTYRRALLVLALAIGGAGVAACGGSSSSSSSSSPSTHSASYVDGYNYAVSVHEYFSLGYDRGVACGYYNGIVRSCDAAQANEGCNGVVSYVPSGDSGHDWLTGCEAAAEANAQAPINS